MNPSDITNFINTDLKLVSEFQAELHGLLVTKKKEEITSKFSNNYLKTSISTKAKNKLNLISKDETYVYEINKKYDFLSNTYFIINLPEIYVKSTWKGKVQICWTKNLAHNIIKFASLKSGDNNLQTYDSIWLDNNMQYNEIKYEDYSKMIGNKKNLTEWNEYLQKDTIIGPQFFYYSKHISSSFPICIINSEENNQTYGFRLKISDLIRVRVRDKENNSWIQVESKNVSTYINLEENSEIKPPQLWGEYYKIRDDELVWYTENNKVVYSEDIISIDQQVDPISLGSSVALNLHSEYPVKAIYWVAENISATKLNNFSNYTTDKYNIENGDNPCEKMNITYKGKERYIETNSIHHDIIEPYYRSNNIPRIAGYNMKSISHDPNSLNGDIGKVFDLINETKIAITLKEDSEKNAFNIDNIGKETEETIPLEIANGNKKERINKDKYMIHIRMPIIKKLTFENGKIIMNSQSKIAENVNI
uniref:Major capsid protein n=1 Tax=Pithovirus LCPAC104 TaxID=2506589 RepID=A0A481Z441_9VIRU|nr:MAG: major capsid protein [Pithovirus LCPAC104]